jgi:hypothetical protein
MFICAVDIKNKSQCTHEWWFRIKKYILQKQKKIMKERVQGTLLHQLSIFPNCNISQNNSTLSFSVYCHWSSSWPYWVSPISLLSLCMSVCLVLCNFTAYVGLCVHHESESTVESHHHKYLSCCPFLTHMCLPRNQYLKQIW